MTDAAKLVVIRGPSGAGKSTIARLVAARSTRPTALVARDDYMFMFNEAARFTIDQELIEMVVLRCLQRGVDVVFEGNFKAETHRELLDRLLEAHPHETYLFYVDVSLEESLRRHETRRQIISTEKMRELHPFATPLGDPREVVIPERASANEAAAIVMRTARLPMD